MSLHNQIRLIAIVTLHTTLDPIMTYSGMCTINFHITYSTFPFLKYYRNTMIFKTQANLNYGLYIQLSSRRICPVFSVILPSMF